jgi:hypothetical protein
MVQKIAHFMEARKCKERGRGLAFTVPLNIYGVLAQTGSASSLRSQASHQHLKYTPVKVLSSLLTD